MLARGETESHILLMGVQNSTATIGGNLVIYQNDKCKSNRERIITYDLTYLCVT